MRHIHATWAGLILLGMLLPPAQAEQDLPTFERPAYSPVLRQAEDWSGLSGLDTTATGDWFDRIKYVPLSGDGKVWASFGGQLRLRTETWSNFGFGPANDDTYLLSRLRLHGDLHIGENLRFFAEGKSALATDRDLPGGRRGLDVDELDLLQAFAELTVPLNEKLTLRVQGGRQMLLFSKQRLVSPLDWSNTMRSWDGVLATVSAEVWKVTGFWTRFAPIQKYEFNDSTDDDQLYGLYATGKCMDCDITFDAYWLGRDRDPLGEERHTIGGRIGGKLFSAFDYDLEGAYQFGDIGGLDIGAYMIASQFGYTFANCPAKPRLFLGVDYASGDDDPADGDSGTFSQLFPLGHAYLGYIDVVGRQNILDLSAGVSLTPFKKLTVSLTGHVFRRAEVNDALYNAGAAVVRAGAPGTSRDVGGEIDLVVKYKLDRHTLLMVGYSHFFPGRFIEQTGSSKDIDFVYTSIQFTF